MLLKIEPPGARTAGYARVPQRHAPRSGACVLDFVMERQALARWCWAAIAASVARYYGTRTWRQHEVASALLGFDCASFQDTPEVAARCDTYAMLDTALQLVGCYSHWSPERPTFERIQAEIDAGRPVCLRIGWYRSGSHYVALTGYCAETGEVYVTDPLHGPSVQPFDTFPNTYRVLGGAWRETYWTAPSGTGARAVSGVSP